MVKVIACAIKTCPSSRGHKSKLEDASLSFFQPTSSLRLQTWSKSLGFPLKTTDHICQLHFKKENIRTHDQIKIGNVSHLLYLRKKGLKNNAVPTVQYQSKPEWEDQDVITPDEQNVQQKVNQSETEEDTEDEQAGKLMTKNSLPTNNTEEMDDAGVARMAAYKKRPFPCTVCGKRFILKHHLTTHMITHTGERNHICSECGKSFSRKHCLNNHILLLHGDNIVYECNECGKQFRLKQHLQRHAKTHNREFFTCGTCGQRFRRHSDLLLHVHDHLADPSHACDDCDACFDTEAKLVVHSKIHGRLALECHICARQFLKQASLDAHVVTHFEQEDNAHEYSYEATEQMDEDGYPVSKKIKKTSNTESDEDAPWMPPGGASDSKNSTNKQIAKRKQSDTIQNGEISQEETSSRRMNYKGNFKCYKCNVCFMRKHLLELHNKIHEEEKNEDSGETDVVETGLVDIKKESAAVIDRSNDFYVTVEEVPVEFSDEED